MARDIGDDTRLSDVFLAVDAVEVIVAHREGRPAVLIRAGEVVFVEPQSTIAIKDTNTLPI